MPSKKVLEIKQEVVSVIKDKIENSASVIFVDYRGLTVDETNLLRIKLKESDTELKIYKNTLVRRALENLKLDLGDVLEGPSAITISKEMIDPIKVLTNFAKEHKTLTIKGGIIEGKISTLEELNNLATIPSRETLLNMLAGGMMEIVKDLSICLNLYSEQKNN
ncbi:MAG: 50S ribosomal protein L10 [Mollicutes bacterium]|nr:50S ribosomal protein L10 [Mollicutes bacterium]